MSKVENVAQSGITIVRTPASDQSLKARSTNLSQLEVLYKPNDTTFGIVDEEIIENSERETTFEEFKQNKMLELSKRRKINKVSSPVSKYGIYCLRFTDDKKYVAVGYGNGGMHLIKNDPDSQTVSPLLHGQKRQLAAMSIKFQKQNNLMLVGGAAGEINVWDCKNIPSGEPKASLNEESNEIYTLDICSDGMFFATAGKDRNIRLYDTNSLCLYHLITAPNSETLDDSIFGGHTQKVFALKFHPEENHIFITAGWDNCMKVWDKRMSRAARKSIAGPRVCGSALDIQGRDILTGSYVAKDALQIWDLRSGCLRKNLSFPHDKHKGDFLYCASFMNEDTVVAGGSGINTVCSVDLKTDKVIDAIGYEDKAILAVETCDQGKVIASGGIGGILQLAFLKQ